MELACGYNKEVRVLLAGKMVLGWGWVWLLTLALVMYSLMSATLLSVSALAR